MKKLETVFIVGSAIIGLCVGVWAISEARVWWLREYGTQIESATTDIYRQNKSYVEGTIRDLRELRLQYETNPEHREAIATLFKHRAAELSSLPSDLRIFLKEIE